CPSSGNGNSVGVEHCACLKHVVCAPQFPHTFCEVWIEVAVEDGIAHDLVSVSRAAVNNFSCECEAWSNCLTVEVGRVIVVRRLQPLVCVQVMNVVLFRPRM